jgi:hypothetical protein
VCNLPGELEQEVQPLYNYDDIVIVIKHRLQESHRVAQGNLMKFKEKQQIRGHSKESGKEIEIDDLVLLRKEQRKHKLDPLWDGPFEVRRFEYPNLVIQRLGRRKQERVQMNPVKRFYCSREGDDEVASPLRSS